MAENAVLTDAMIGRVKQHGDKNSASQIPSEFDRENEPYLDHFSVVTQVTSLAVIQVFLSYIQSFVYYLCVS